MERPAWAPEGIDLSKPSVSRMYDYYLGGSHNFEVDRRAARQVLALVPGTPKLAQANRAFMRRAVRHVAAEGVTQFLDIGSGIPTFGNVHEVAREAAGPAARVVYVDNDPVAVAHSRAVLADEAGADIAAADLREPRALLASEPVRRLLDLDRPVALLLVAVLHFFDDRDRPHEALATLRDALAPGSFLILTHASADGSPETSDEGAGVVDIYRREGATLALRSAAEINRFFDGFDLVEPGLVGLPQWRPDSAIDEEDPVVHAGFAGVGRRS